MQEVQDQYNIEKSILVNKTLKVFVLLQLLATALSVYRGFILEWYPIINLHIIFMVASFFLLSFSNKISYNGKALYITAMIQIAGMATLFNIGPTNTQGMFILTTVIMVATLFKSFYAYLLMAFNIVLVQVVAYLFCFTEVEIIANPRNFLENYIYWALNSTVYLLFSVIGIKAISEMKGIIWKCLRVIEKQNKTKY